MLCALPKLFTQNRYSPIIAVYSIVVVHYRDTIICAYCMFEKEFNALSIGESPSIYPFLKNNGNEAPKGPSSIIFQNGQIRRLSVKTFSD